MSIELNDVKSIIPLYHNSILSVNVRSYNRNVDQIIDLSSLKPSILNLCEIFHPYSFNIKGYSSISYTRLAGKGGGLGLMVRNDICFQEYDSINKLKTYFIEKIAIEIIDPYNKFTFVCLYRPPGCNIKNSLY